MRTFIDVGCAKGTYAFGWMRDPSNQVFAFEPLPEFYEELKQKESDQFHVYPYAITDQDGVADFYVNDVRVTSSLKPLEAGSMFTTMQHIQVETKRLDTFCREYKIDSIYLLKSDAQGADLEVLKSLGEWLVRVREIIVEAFLLPRNIYVGEINKKQDVCNYLSAYGFKLLGQRDEGDYTDLTFQRG